MKKEISPATADLVAADRIDGWYPLQQLDLLATYAAQQARRGQGRFLEIGTWKGRSARVLAPFGKLTCVDTWKGIPGKNDPRYEETGILGQARTNLAGFDVKFCIGDSREILPQFANETFDLIHIDGDHTYPTIEFDVLRSWVLLRKEGILCGDDFNEPDVYRAVMSIPDNDLRLVIYNKRFWVTEKLLH